MAKIIDKIVKSSKAPSRNDLWLNDGQLKVYQGGKWKSLSPSKEVNSETDSNTTIKATSITYQELKNLRDTASLTPGQKYRIIDYETTVSKPYLDVNSESQYYYFDVVVTAIDESTLSEEAEAVRSARDTQGLLKDFDLSKWKLWYLLDNNRERANWSGTDDGYIKEIQVVMEGNTEDSFLLRDEGYDKQLSDGTIYYGWKFRYRRVGDGGTKIVNTNTVDINNVTTLYDYYSGKELTDIRLEVFEKTGNPGKGVIYRMVDDRNNDLYYDFYNILVPFTETLSGYSVKVGDIIAPCSRYFYYDTVIEGEQYYGWGVVTSYTQYPGLSTPFPTYTYVRTKSDILTYDTVFYSIQGSIMPNITVVGLPTTTYTCSSTFNVQDTNNYNIRILSSNDTLTLKKANIFDSGQYYNICINDSVKNSFKSGGYNIVLEANSDSNIFEASHDVKFEGYVQESQIKNSYNILIKYGSYTNKILGTFARPSYDIEIDGHDNTVNEGCYTIKIDSGQIDSGSTISIGCNNINIGLQSNATLGNGCSFITVGTSSSGTFEYGCDNVVVGSFSYDNTFSSRCNNITIGDHCSNNSISSYSSDITFGNGCENNKITGQSYYITLGGYSTGNTVMGNNISIKSGLTDSTITAGNTTIGSGCINLNLDTLEDSKIGNNCANILSTSGDICHLDIREYCQNIVINLDDSSTGTYAYGMLIEASTAGTDDSPKEITLIGKNYDEILKESNTPNYIVGPTSTGEIVTYCVADLVGNSSSSEGGIRIVTEEYLTSKYGWELAEELKADDKIWFCDSYTNFDTYNVYKMIPLTIYYDMYMDDYYIAGILPDGYVLYNGNVSFKPLASAVIKYVDSSDLAYNNHKISENIKKGYLYYLNSYTLSSSNITYYKLPVIATSSNYIVAILPTGYVKFYVDDDNHSANEYIPFGSNSTTDVPTDIPKNIIYFDTGKDYATYSEIGPAAELNYIKHNDKLYEATYVEWEYGEMIYAFAENKFIGYCASEGGGEYDFYPKFTISSNIYDAVHSNTNTQYIGYRALLATLITSGEYKKHSNDEMSIYTKQDGYTYVDATTNSSSFSEKASEAISINVKLKVKSSTVTILDIVYKYADSTKEDAIRFINSKEVPYLKYNTLPVLNVNSSAINQDIINSLDTEYHQCYLLIDNEYYLFNYHNNIMTGIVNDELITYEVRSSSIVKQKSIKIDLIFEFDSRIAALEKSLSQMSE